MTSSLFFIQLLNGLQLGVPLFMLSAGLTLVFGIMSFVNLAHGCLYMMGAYFAATVYAATDSFVAAGVAAVVGGGLLAALLLPTSGLSRAVPLAVSAAYLFIAFVVLRPAKFYATS